MSPRSDEYIGAAERKLAAARLMLGSGLSEDAAGAAYYAMLNAAQAANSEHGRYSKTHRGAWILFSQLFVRTGRVPEDLQAVAEDARQLREQADYGGGGADAAQAEMAVAGAERFVQIIRELFAD